MQTYQPSPIYDQAIYLEKTGCYVMKYSTGMAVMYLPSFIAAHIWAKIAGYPADGYSFPYQFMISIGSIIFSCIGLWFSRKLLLKYFPDSAVAVSLLLLTVGTNYLFYVSFDGPLTHSYLFGLYALLIYFSDNWLRKPSYTSSIFIGFICGLATIIRPTEIISCLIPLLWGIHNKESFFNKLQLLKDHYRKIFITGLLFALVSSIQLLYWKIHTGNFLFYSYQDQGFSFLKPHLINYLFSYKKGWLIYTPMMLFSIAGFITLYKLRRKIFYPSIFFFLLFLYIAASWDIWWYGGSCTQRSIIQCYAILLIPLSSFFSFNIKKKLLYSMPFIIFFTWINLFQIWQVFGAGIMDCDQMNRTYYWKIFGKTAIASDARKLLDTNENEPSNKIIDTYKIFYHNDIEETENRNCEIASSGNCAIKLDQENQFSEDFKILLEQRKSGWIRFSAKIFFSEKEYDTWKQTEMIITFYNENDQPIKAKQIRIQRITEPGNWTEVFFDTEIPTNKEPYYVKLSFWNASGNKTIFIDNLRLYHSKNI